MWINLLKRRIMENAREKKNKSDRVYGLGHIMADNMYPGWLLISYSENDLRFLKFVFISLTVATIVILIGAIICAAIII